MTTDEDLMMLCVNEINGIGQSSTSRPHTALRTAYQLCEFRPWIAWKLIMREWSGFDLIPHDDYQMLFNLRAMRRWWHPSLMPEDAQEFYDGLPDRVTVWRGQDAGAGHAMGLSWTTDLDVARTFALGHRGIFNPDPAVLQATVAKQDIAFVTVERCESEIVMRSSPQTVTAR